MRYFGCDCRHEVIGVELFCDFQLYFAFYEFSGGKIPLKDRIRHAWKILTRGVSIPNEIFLSLKEAEKLSEEIAKIVAEIAKHEQEAEQARKKLENLINQDSLRIAK